MADLNDVLLALGRVQEGVDRLRDDFTEEKRSAATSRKALYEKHDDLSDDLARLKVDIGITGQINAQVREEVKTLGERVAQHKAEIQPSIEDWRKIKTLGLGVSGILAIGGLSVGAMLMMGVDAIKAALRQWMG